MHIVCLIDLIASENSDMVPPEQGLEQISQVGSQTTGGPII